MSTVSTDTKVSTTKIGNNTYRITKGDLIFDNIPQQAAFELQLFLIGQKPMILIRSEYIDSSKISQYYIQETLKTKTTTKTLIFQNEEVHRNFVSNVSKIDEETGFHTIGNHIMMGVTLGYPPIACETFGSREPSSCYGVRYHGLSFTCPKEHIDTAIKWLKENYQIPEEYQTDSFYKKAGTIDEDQVYF